ncbi:GCG_CRPN prefix-to-repeats domain-containing protein [Methylobacterium komagatae]|uniref:GCG_CRPN prefix-to-repeats domain-containing protein n=1 Tax=Methylobacterium komagatae TaxID=374425 RepID=A0ABW2BLA4_9HYPH
MRMKLIGAALLAVGTVAATAGTAEARDGCGPGFHRNFYGYCRPNGFYRPIVVRPVYGYGWRRPWGWHRPVAYGGWHRHWGWHHGWRRW